MSGPTGAAKWQLRVAVVRRWGSRCYICFNPIASADLSLDHIIPQSQGGKWRVDNLRPTHARCNAKRGVRAVIDPQAEPSDYRALYNDILRGPKRKQRGRTRP